MTKRFKKTPFILASLCLGLSVSYASFADPAEGSLGVATQSMSVEAPTWDNATHAHFDALTGDQFSVLTSDNRSFNLTMKNIIVGERDENRPAFLGRKQSFIVVFSGSQEDAEWLLNNRSHSMKIWHKDLGNGQALVNATLGETGTYEFEIVFN